MNDDKLGTTCYFADLTLKNESSITCDITLKLVSYNGLCYFADIDLSNYSNIRYSYFYTNDLNDGP
jgi:hypothetical protein